MPKIFTKQGDQGQTQLATGQRVSKSAPVIAVLGELDELNSWLGLVKSQLTPKTDQTVIKLLTEIQTALFQLSAVVAGGKNTNSFFQTVEKLETAIESRQHQLGPNWAAKFIYPGGSILGSWFNLSRAVCRRAERQLVAWQEETKPILPAGSLELINRLADYLYAQAVYYDAQVVSQLKYLA